MDLKESNYTLTYPANDMVIKTSQTTTESISRLSIGVENIYPALVECFGIICLGYLAGRFKLFSENEAKGLGTFVGTFALPAMIFTALCTLNLNNVNWKFVFSIFITKSIIFITVLIVSLLVNHGEKIGRAGLYSIFVTQSNDFALGYPILTALYSKSHPDYPTYLYLLSPVSLAILNPIGCILMEIDKVNSGAGIMDQENVDASPQDRLSRKEDKNVLSYKSSETQEDSKTVSQPIVGIDENQDEQNTQLKEERKYSTENALENGSMVGIQEQPGGRLGASSKMKTICKVVLGILSNPIIVLTFAGLICGQFLFHGSVPPILNNFLQTLKSAYSATALFSLGLGMVGKMETLKNGSKLLGPSILIVAKVILMPLIARGITNLMYWGSTEEESSGLSDLAFLYGTFPTAPTVYVLATRFQIASSIIATSMIACTFLSAPIMFISAQLLAASKTPFEYHNLLENKVFEICIVSLVAIVWTMFIMLYTSKRWHYMPHSQTVLLLIAQGTACCGSLFYYCLDFSTIWTQYLQFILLLFGVYASRINSGIIAVTLFLLTKGKTKLVGRLQPYLLILGVVGPAIFVCILLAVSPSIKEFNGSNSVNFKFGRAQAIVSLTVLAMSFSVILLSLILSQRRHKQKKMGLLSRKRASSETREKYSAELLKSVGLNPDRLSDIEDDDCCNWKNTRGKKKNERDCQMIRHTVLLIYSAISIVLGIALCTTKILYENTTDVGIYFIIVILDTTMNFGQGLMTCAVFGFESKYVFLPLHKVLKKARNMYTNIKKMFQLKM